MSLIPRAKYFEQMLFILDYSPVLAILGPRQCGKTTLSKQFAQQEQAKEATKNFHFFDLENPVDLARLENPMLSLGKLKGYIILDEIQRRPELFPVLRVLVDEWRAQNVDNRLIILGSASRDLIQQSSETLAGRISYMELGGLSLNAVGTDKDKELWLKGGFPLSFLAKTNKISWAWRQDFVSTFLERDIPNLGFNIPARSLRQFWTMLAHYHGQVFNASELARSIDSSVSSMRRYLDLLSATFMVRVLQPWFNNTKKRLVKSPKIYFRDSGILHFLLGIQNHEALESNPKLGFSWEGFVLEQFIKAHNIKDEDCFFWSTHSGAEIDFVYRSEGKLYGLEIKYSDAPKLTPSMKIALDELDLENIKIIYPGEQNYSLADKVDVMSLADSL